LLVLGGGGGVCVRACARGWACAHARCKRVLKKQQQGHFRSESSRRGEMGGVAAVSQTTQPDKPTHTARPPTHPHTPTHLKPKGAQVVQVGVKVSGDGALFTARYSCRGRKQQGAEGSAARHLPAFRIQAWLRFWGAMVWLQVEWGRGLPSLGLRCTVRPLRCWICEAGAHGAYMARHRAGGRAGRWRTPNQRRPTTHGEHVFHKPSPTPVVPSPTSVVSTVDADTAPSPVVGLAACAWCDVGCGVGWGSGPGVGPA
jgi:hypothetical protein